LTYLFIAHDLAVVRHLATRVVVLYLGQIMETAPVDSLYDAPAHPYTAALLDAIPVPDPAVTRERVILRQDLTEATAGTQGCVFAARCRHPAKDDRCSTERPELRPLGLHSWVACHHADEPTKE
jgi:oligopeptide/dipeptide ABC transporter ATP-binding protein